jgi:hypothetical protein
VEDLFYDIDDDVEIGLYDEDFIDEKFTLTWKTKQICAIGDDGEETG